jgi:aerobic-type carbon monoxide dehydrogenase small subunit (CoxS/CutS family)
MVEKAWVVLNGRKEHLPFDGRRLIDWLRDDMGLTGTKQPCGAGHCGGCSVLLDGSVVPACCILTASVAGRTIETIEGLAELTPEDPLFEAFIRHGALQCGYCTPGMIIAARAFLNELHVTASPGSAIDHKMIQQALAGNICRCTGYVQIVEAVRAAACQEGFVSREAPRETWSIASACKREELVPQDTCIHNKGEKNDK